MRDLSAGRVARSTWIDSCSRDLQVCAKAASKARSSNGNVRSMELQHTNRIHRNYYDLIAFTSSQMLPLLHVWQLVTDCLKEQSSDALAARTAGQC